MIGEREREIEKVEEALTAFPEAVSIPSTNIKDGH